MGLEGSFLCSAPTGWLLSRQQSCLCILYFHLTLHRVRFRHLSTSSPNSRNFSTMHADRLAPSTSYDSP